ncbi:hypothetical protein C2S53_016747 [Perilla frutescens var. hirtella]|uniref:Uncharacterized protein n=1 Tax=Perilla frutescens var. hirtella TaxID=608512 RepID=A0AAD4P4S2_PERFH|nr:hypothetical protein C2S53_016747 [Perilla frutescens var. hirtella]
MIISEFSWKSPIPYLFGGLALVLVLIVLSLAILVCTGRKGSSEEGPTVSGSGEVELGGKPQLVVVVMAGDDRPNYLAVPHL